MTEIFEGFGMHMMHAKIHETSEGCCCLKDLPCEHCPSHPNAYPSRLAAAETMRDQYAKTIELLTAENLNVLIPRMEAAEDALIAAEQTLATEVANCAQALFDMNQGRLAAEAALSEARAALEDLFKFGGIGVDGQGHIFIRDEHALVDQLVKTAESLASLSSPATETTEAQTKLDSSPGDVS